MSNIIVNIKQGDLRGFSVISDGGINYNIFLGIPYAEQPIGNLRFKAPVPVKNWIGIRDATKEGGIAAQYDMFTKKYSGSDDCLYLNVYSPITSTADLLPVMINFHGGGLIQGSGSRDNFDPEFIVEKGIVVVTFNYRLGVMGFLCTDAENATGDMALKDQNLVLKWVQDNIASFNGDPNNVTLSGISAGAALIEYQLLAESSQNLFHKAMIRSGSVLNAWSRTRNGVERAERLAKYLGYQNSNESLFNFINNIDTERLVNASANLCTSEELKNGEIFAFTPVINELKDYDGFINGEPIDLLKNGKYHKVPTIAGVCEKEGILMKALYIADDVKEILKTSNYIEAIPRHLNKNIDSLSERLRDLYKPQKHRDIIVDFLTDVNFFGGVASALKYRLMHNPGQNYFYCFKYDGDMNLVKKSMKSTEIGASHGDDACYDTKSNWNTTNPTDVVVKNRQIQMWSDFAKSGNPTPKKTELIEEIWTPVIDGRFQYLEIDVKMKMKDSLWSERKQLWNELYDF